MLLRLWSASLTTPLHRALPDHPGHLIPEVVAQPRRFVHGRLVPPAATTHHVVAPCRLPGDAPAMRCDLSDCRLTLCILPTHARELTHLVCQRNSGGSRG